MMTNVPTPIQRHDNDGARLMATAWAEYFVALTLGDPAASAFAEWLAGFWEPSLERPDGVADVRNPFAAGGRGIDWFERDGWVRGHIPGHAGGYLVPRAAIFAHLSRPGLAPAA
jgi:hypothetical protein